jgi:hypothetical protein
LFIEIARRVWLRRNDFVFGKAFQHPAILVTKAKEYVSEFMAVMKNRNMTLPNAAVTRERKWTAPEARWLKANWDAFFSKTQGWMGFGVVVRDKTGIVLAA